MPELPEVETVRRGLEPAMAGRRLLSVSLARADLRFPFPENFAARLTGTEIRSLERRGKYLLAPLGSGETLLMHLGMSGRFTVAMGGDGAPAAGAPAAAAVAQGAFTQARALDPKHDHVVFELDAGARVTFNDPRRFGYMDLAPTATLAACRHFARLGPEPLSAAFDGAALTRALAGRAAPIKAALLDQRVVAGLGNIYVCEALFRAGINPQRPAGALTARQAARLAEAVKAVLADAIAAGGSTLRDYAHADGSLGYFQHAFAVYGREGAACAREGCAGAVRRIVQANRSSYFCPVCQR